MIALYLGFEITLAGWTILSCEGDVQIMFYLATVIVLCLLGAVILGKQKKNLYCGTLAALALVSVGASLALRMDLAGGTGSHSEQFFEDSIIMVAVFIFTYVMIRYTSVYRMEIFNRMIILLLPMSLLIARLRGEATGGAYIISFFGVLIFALILAGYPFAAAYFLTRPEEKYLRGDIRSLPMNLTFFLIYNLVLYSISTVCREFGLVLVLGIASTVLFYHRCKNFQTKLIYSVLCASGAGLAAIFTSHIHDRVLIWLHLKDIQPDDDLAGKAESILYLFENLPRAGFWGNGLGTTPTSLIPTLNSDHAFATIILEYSVIFAAAILFCGIVLIKCLLKGCYTENAHAYYLNLTAGLLVGATMLIHVGSNLGSFITAGVGFPFLSEGSSVNSMFAILLAINVAIHERGRKNNGLSKRKER